MPKIVFTVTSDLSYDQRMDRICSSLSNAGYDITLVGRKLKSSIPISHKNYNTVRFNNLFSKGKLFYLEYNIRLFFFLLARKYDILCSIDLDTIAPGFFISKLKGKTLVYDAHEYFPEQAQIKNRKLTKWVWTSVERMIVPKLKHAYTVNHSLARLFKEQYGTPFSVITNAAIRNVTSIEKTEETPFFIYTGWVDPHRGLEELIEAAPLLKLPLVIVGDGVLLETLKKTVAEKNLQDKVRFTGFMEPDKLRHKISQAYAGFLLVENLGLSYYYALGNKFFDYVQGGIPQISIDFPEYKLMNEKHGVSHLISSLDPEVIAAAANELVDNPKLYEKIKTNAINAQEDLSWEHEEKKLVAFYDKLS